MEKRRFCIKVSDFFIYGSIFLMVARDFLRVLLGSFVITVDGWSFERYTSPVMSVLAYISIILLLLSVKKIHTTQMPQNVRNAFWIITIISFFWTMHSVFTVQNYNILTLDGTAKTVWISMFGLYLGYSKDAWAKIERLIPMLSVLYMTISFGYILYIRYGGMWHQQTNQAPYWMIYSTAFWLFAFFVLCYENEFRGKNQLTIFLFMMNVVIVSFTISRGWLLQSISVLFLFLLLNNTDFKKRKVSFVLVMLLIAILGIYTIRDEIMLYLSSYITKFESLGSRTSQFDAFFSQVPISRMLLGGGEYASYIYKNNPNYIYIDNSYLYYAFHFGGIFCITMLLLPLRQAFSCFRLRKFGKEYNIAFVLIMWIAALSGVSVFCAGYEVSFRTLFIMILVGRAAYISRYPKKFS